MLNTVKVLLPILSKLKSLNHIGLMLIFFDGEEAFRTWSASDSLYGSRHLAKMWKTKKYTRSDCQITNEISRIDVMVLLDLIGAPNQRFYSFFDNTAPLYMQFYQIERNLKTLNLLQGSNYMFTMQRSFSRIEDDHLPFLNSGVPILHLIPTPFPKYWHKPQDNKESLSGTTIRNFNNILRIFVYEFLMNNKLSEKDLRPCPKRLF